MDKLLTTQELAERLNVPLTWVYERTRKGELKVIKLGRYCRFKLEDVERFLEKQKLKQTTKEN